MTNREALLKEMEQMSDDALAKYLDQCIGEIIMGGVCDRCYKEHGEVCIWESQELDDCPKKLIDWLREEH